VFRPLLFFAHAGKKRKEEIETQRGTESTEKKERKLFAATRGEK
jgi:hypothetical protein